MKHYRYFKQPNNPEFALQLIIVRWKKQMISVGNRQAGDIYYGVTRMGKP